MMVLSSEHSFGSWRTCATVTTMLPTRRVESDDNTTTAPTHTHTHVHNGAAGLGDEICSRGVAGRISAEHTFANMWYESQRF